MSEGEQTSETRTAAPRKPVESPIVRAGDKVGRFSIVSELGAGGMGRIYEAHDPELDRRIALKLLRDSGEEGHRQRLALEAQALARLDHPNVVTVHDVGVHEGSLFVAMALFRGGTLKDWSAKNPIGSKERFGSAIGLLIDAGRGLVAAHEAGLVHRDVKPSNILIGEDGRARVADFGIARAVASPPSRPRTSDLATSDKELQQSLDDTQPSLTRTGASVGTPAYMAPEQFSGRRIDAAADQFSFCVMAWELLFGVRPFGGVGVRQRLTQIRDGELRRAEKVEVDTKVVALLERGLRYRSSTRHRRLAELVDALSESVGAVVGPRRRSLWRWGLAVGGVAAVGAGAAYRIGQTEQLCTGAVAAFDEVWGDEQREDMRNAVLGSELEFAPGAWVRLEAGLDSYGQAWRRAHTEACEATIVRGEQSPERMEERLACLEDAKRSVGALVTLVSQGEASVLASEQELRGGLRKVEECEDIRGTPTPAELSILDAVADAGAQRRAGQPRKALAIIVSIAERLDDEVSAIVRARVLMEHGRGLAEAYPRQALDVLSEAYGVAHAGGFSQIASAAAREVAELHVRLSGNADAVQRWLGLAKSQSGATSVSEEYELVVLEGMLAELQGNDDGAARAFERSIEIAKGESALLPDALRNLATHLGGVDAERAAKIGREALKEYANLFGRDHPGVATFEVSLAGLLARIGRREEAEQLARRALARATKTWGQGHAATGRYLVQLAEIRCSLSRDVEEGTRLASAALKLHPRSEPTLERFETLLALEVCVRSNDPAGSLEATRQLLELSKELYGNDHFRTLLSRILYAAALFQSSDVVETRKQISLSTAATDLKAPGWEGQRAAHVHSVLAVLAGGFAEMTAMARENAEAAQSLNDRTAPAGAVTRVVWHSDLCSAKRVLGQLEGALAECLVAFELSADFDQGVSRATLEYELGWILNALRRSDEALGHMENAAGMFKEVNGTRSLHTAMGEAGLALVKEELGRYAEAEKHYRASFDSFSRFEGATSSQLESGAGLARVVARRGRVGEALALLDELEKLRKGMTVRDRARLFSSRGAVLHTKNPRLGAREYSRAIDFYRAGGDDDAIQRLCERAPFALPGCDAADTNPD